MAAIKLRIRDSPASVQAVARFFDSKQAHAVAGVAHPRLTVGSYVWALRRSGHAWSDIAQHLKIGVQRAKSEHSAVISYLSGERGSVSKRMKS